MSNEYMEKTELLCRESSCHGVDLGAAWRPGHRLVCDVSFVRSRVLDLFIVITFSGKGAVKHFEVRQFITLLLLFSLHHVLCII